MKGGLEKAIKDADIFIGVSVGDVVSADMVKSMAEKAVVFALANPRPEIPYEDAKNAGAFIVGTGSSMYPNQINNSLVFPGLFRGVLDVSASVINTEMKISASKAIASCVSKKELCVDYILPDMFNKDVHKAVAKAVATAAKKTKVART